MPTQSIAPAATACDGSAIDSISSLTFIDVRDQRQLDDGSMT